MRERVTLRPHEILPKLAIMPLFLTTHVHILDSTLRQCHGLTDRVTQMLNLHHLQKDSSQNAGALTNSRLVNYHRSAKWCLYSGFPVEH